MSGAELHTGDTGGSCPASGEAPSGASRLPHPVVGLLRRYGAIFKLCWAHRQEMAGPARLADEAAFLPAALSLQETPVHPAPRRLALLLISLFLIALAWAIVGKVDIVAVAPGQVVVSERTKVIQPLEPSVVLRVLVKDGDRVQAGQLLVELDPTMAMADSGSVGEQLMQSQSELARTTALLDALSQKSLPNVLHFCAGTPIQGAAATGVRVGRRSCALGATGCGNPKTQGRVGGGRTICRAC